METKFIQMGHEILGGAPTSEILTHLDGGPTQIRQNQIRVLLILVVLVKIEATPRRFSVMSKSTWSQKGHMYLVRTSGLSIGGLKGESVFDDPNQLVPMKILGRSTGDIR
jgi:hypothetical protein